MQHPDEKCMRLLIVFNNMLRISAESPRFWEKLFVQTAQRLKSSAENDALIVKIGDDAADLFSN